MHLKIDIQVSNDELQYKYLSRALFGMPMKIEADGMAEKATVDSW